MARTSGVEYVSPYAGPALMARQTSSLAAEPAAAMHLLDTEHGFIETAKQLEVTHKHHLHRHHETQQHHKFEDWKKLVKGVYNAASLPENPHTTHIELHDTCKRLASGLASKMSHGGLTEDTQKQLFEKYLVDMLLRIHEPRVLGTLIAMRSLPASSSMWGKLGHIQTSNFAKNKGTEYYIFKVPYGRGKETIDFIGKEAYIDMKKGQPIKKNVDKLEESLKALDTALSGYINTERKPEDYKLLPHSKGGRRRKNKKNKGKGKNGAMAHGHSNGTVARLREENAYLRGKHAGMKHAHGGLFDHDDDDGIGPHRSPSRGGSVRASSRGSHRSRPSLFDDEGDLSPRDVSNHNYVNYPHTKRGQSADGRHTRPLFAR